LQGEGDEWMKGFLVGVWWWGLVGLGRTWNMYALGIQGEGMLRKEIKKHPSKDPVSKCIILPQDFQLLKVELKIEHVTCRYTISISDFKTQYKKIGLTSVDQKKSFDICTIPTNYLDTFSRLPFTGRQ
jgi:hypothetical protein